MKNPFDDHHIIFSAEGAMHPVKWANPPTHEQTLDYLKSQGENAVSVEGHYGSPERSILVNSPKNPKGIHQMATDLGQDSILESKGGKHALTYLNGPNKNKQITGEGTTFHPMKPADMFTTMKTPTGDVHFSHNLNFGKSEGLAKMPKIFDSKGGKPKMMHRVQNELGEGPYQEFDWEDEPHTSETGHPEIHLDPGFTPKDKAAYDDTKHVSGFETEKQLKDYFSGTELSKLAERGFYPTQVPAQKAWSSGKQAFFDKYSPKVKKPKL